MSVLIVFDWDDTLFPTSFSLSDPRLRPLFHKKRAAGGRAERAIENNRQLRALQAAAINAIKVASQIGRVVIITLAEEAWVRHASGMLMPGLFRLIEESDLQVLSAQDFHTAAFEDSGNLEDSHGNGAMPNLTPLIECKAAAMRQCIPSGFLDQICSIGDSEVEAQAARQVSMERNSLHPCLHKVLKLCEMPTIEMLTAELNTAASWLPQAVEYRQSIFADIRSLHSKVGACPTRKVRTPVGTQRQQEENKENEQNKDWSARPLGVNVRRDGTPTAGPVPPNRSTGRGNMVGQPRKRSPNPATTLGLGRKGDSAPGLLCDAPTIQAPVALIGVSPIRRLPSIKMRHQ